MPCPHNEITIVQRSQRQSAVAAAAYQSGEKLFCEYDQQVKHYPEKRGIVHNEILLPANAPQKYADRNTLNVQAPSYYCSFRYHHLYDMLCHQQLFYHQLYWRYHAQKSVLLYSPIYPKSSRCILPNSDALLEKCWKTGAATAQRGAATAQRGAATAQRGAATAQRGAATAQRGAAPRAFNSGVVPRGLGVGGTSGRPI